MACGHLSNVHPGNESHQHQWWHTVQDDYPRTCRWHKAYRHTSVFGTSDTHPPHVVRQLQLLEAGSKAENGSVPDAREVEVLQEDNWKAWTASWWKYMKQIGAANLSGVDVLHIHQVACQSKRSSRGSTKQTNNTYSRDKHAAMTQSVKCEPQEGRHNQQ